MADANSLEKGEHGREKWTYLYAAARRGHRNVAQLLIEGGADPNKGTYIEECIPYMDMNVYKYLEFTPIYKATTKKHLNVVKVLMDAGVDPNRSMYEKMVHM